MLEACTWKDSEVESVCKSIYMLVSSYKSVAKVSTRKVTSSHACSTPLIIWVEFDILPLVILPCPCQLILSSCWGLNGQYKQNHFSHLMVVRDATAKLAWCGYQKLSCYFVDTVAGRTFSVWQLMTLLSVSTGADFHFWITLYWLLLSLAVICRFCQCSLVP